jgi:predicted ATPase/DNA-binding winged helix-turn-helix (wHTH) protein
MQTMVLKAVGRTTPKVRGEATMPAQAKRLVYKFGKWEVDLAERELRSHQTAVSIGTRAFDIMEVLVQSGGELITKDGLMDRVWPGLIIGENALQVHICAVRKALGEDRELLRTVSGRGYRLLGDWKLRDEDRLAPGDFEPARASNTSFRMNLPLATVDLIGRAAALQHLRDLLSAYRMVTLTGPGGIGKTALAFEVARSLFPSFQGDVQLVELAGLSSSELVLSTIARVLGHHLGHSEVSAEAIARATGEKKLLLVLDGCEHVIDAVAHLVQAMMRMCSRISVLATSREFLRVEGEHVFRVPPLDVPQRDRPDDQILEHSAVHFFITRTQMSRSDFSPSKEGLPIIADICRHLDGIPLAIEFAASRVMSLGLHEVASRLDNRFELLTGGRRLALPQHQTLRATLDWSYDLLSEPEQCLLRRLAVFPAGFTLDAATAVARDLRTLSSIADGISDLFSKSLVVLDGPDVPRRWRLLETTRAYAREKLAESDEAELAARYHAEYYRNLIAPNTVGTPVEPAVDDMLRYGREIDNIRVALDWSFSPTGDVITGVVLTAAYVPVWLYFALMTECRERAERAMKSLATNFSISALQRLQLQIALGVAMIYTMGLGESTREDLTQALETAETLGEVDAQLRALWALWALYFYRGDFNQAKSVAERFSSVTLQTADAADALVGDRFVGVAAHFQGQQSDARFHLERVLDLYIAPSDRRHARWFHFDQRVLARAMLARVLLLQGFPEQAADAAELSLSDAQSTHHALTVCNVLGLSVCPLALQTGNLVAADRALAMMADIASQHGMSFWAGFSKHLEGELHIRRGEFRKGVDLLRAGLGTRHGAGGFRTRFLGTLAEGLAGLGQSTEALGTIDQALAAAEEVGQRWYVPELLRLKGELLLREPRDQSFSRAENCFHRALEVAGQQGALYWELRSVISLAQLRMTQGRLDDARQALARVYDQFSEGFETSDLRAARKVLDVLPAQLARTRFR